MQFQYLMWFPLTLYIFVYNVYIIFFFISIFTYLLLLLLMFLLLLPSFLQWRCKCPPRGTIKVFSYLILSYLCFLTFDWELSSTGAAIVRNYSICFYTLNTLFISSPPSSWQTFLYYRIGQQLSVFSDLTENVWSASVCWFTYYSHNTNSIINS